MINKPSNWNEVKEFGEKMSLPLGAYVCKVKKVTIDGSLMQIGFDISEGEYKDFFMKEFKANTNDDKKYKGILRVWLPLDDGSEKDEYTKRTLKGMVTAFENSNSGYTWNWNEQSLVGKTVGVLFRNEEWDYNNKHGWAVRPFRAMSAEKVRTGDYTLPNDKPLNNSAVSAAPSAPVTAGFTAVDDDSDLPF